MATMNSTVAGTWLFNQQYGCQMAGISPAWPVFYC